MIGQALAGRPDLMNINRFGRLEAKRGGLISEIAAASGVPTLICVHRVCVHPAAWDAAMGIDRQLPCSGAALHDWWQTIVAVRQSPPGI